MNKLFSSLTLTAVSPLTIAMTLILPAQAVTLNFSWNGDGGDSAQGSFSYDENTDPGTFSESGPGQTNALQSLNVSFFNSQNNLISAYNNVVNSISSGNYFQFNFNTVTKEIFGTIDVSGEVASETYLSGTFNSNLSLYQVPQSGTDLVIDSNSGSIVVQAVPEPKSIKTANKAVIYWRC